jgi:membrane-bound metal-dependent hydrolase YbcI (DUF457 family)
VFIGHFAVAYASKRFAPRTSLGTLFVAAQWPDLLWPVLVLLGVERVQIAPGDTAATPLRFVSYPYSHSLPADVVWALLLAALYYGVRRYKAGAVAIAVGVVSHWVLDVIVHRADMPVWFAGPKVGLGLWNAPGVEMAIELAMLAAGLVLYARVTRPADRVGRYGTWVLVIVLLAAYLSSALGPPPSVAVVAWVGLIAGWLTILWAFWADAHRTPGTGPGSAGAGPATSTPR